MNGMEKDLVPLNPADLAAEPDFSLGALRCRPSLLTVSAGKRTETLEPRVMQVLVALARRRGEVVTRDQLVELCWEGRVVSDSALHRCTLRLRKISETLGGFTLETIRRVGYRLVEIPDAMPAEVPPAVQSLTPRSSRWLAIPAMALLLLLSGTVLVLVAVKAREATTERERFAATLASITALVDADQYGAAFTLARPLMQDSSFPSPELQALWNRIVVPMRPLVEQDGATLWFKPYADTNGPWIEAGTTPFTNRIDAPRGTLRIKVEKSGFHTGYFAIANPGPSVLTDGPPGTTIPPEHLPQERIPLPLSPVDAPADMVPVPHTNAPVTVRGWTRRPVGDNRQDIPAFLMERAEVTNRQFKEFIDAGGYDDPALWSGLEFRQRGVTLTWEEAKAHFVDATNRPGPATWELGSYPNGEGDMPVSGISWYEAVAYARYRQRMLPTLHHWARAAYSPYDAYFNTRPDIMLQGHFQTEAPVPANTEASPGPWGTVNMAGNVFEWVWNFAGDQGLVMGGSWQKDAYSYSHVETAPPMQRSPHIGMRLMLTDAPVRDELLQAVTLWDTGPALTRQPVSDEYFAAMQLQFAAPDTRVRAQSIATLQETELWIAEEIELSYMDGSTASLILVRPRRNTAPLQAIMYAPGAACCISRRSNREALESMALLEFVVTSGRALVLPIWANSYERYRARLPEVGPAENPRFELELALQFHDDTLRVVDYLQSRDDVDPDRIAYIGNSLGAMSIAAIALTSEKRIRAAVLLAASISAREGIHPMYDVLNFARHITVPVLMLNGRFDTAAAVPTQTRLFKLLGTPDDLKEHHVFDAAHIDLPRYTIARMTSDWFDRHLGKVTPASF